MVVVACQAAHGTIPQMDQVLTSLHANISEVLGIAFMHETQYVGFPGGEPEFVDIAYG